MSESQATPAELTRRVQAVCQANNFVQPIIHQPSYSMLNRWVEPDLLPATTETGMGVIAFCPLAQGLLTDKYLKGIPEDSRAKQKDGFLKEDAVTDELVEKLKKLNANRPKPRPVPRPNVPLLGAPRPRRHQRPRRSQPPLPNHRKRKSRRKNPLLS